MKRFSFLFVFLLFAGVSVCHAQTKIAEFPGGIQAMQKFIAENLRYPAESLNNGSQGKTVLRFVVERDGSITNVEALKYSGDPLLDKEAIRVASVMPKWNPAYEDGTPIRTYYSLPITFKLQSEVQEKEEVKIVNDESKVEAIEMTPDKIAEFPGGIQALYRFLGQNIKYPKISLDSGSQGTTTLRFVVEKNGSISGVQVLRTSGDSFLDKEAVRVVGTMPKWKPGELKGVPVRSYFVLPVKFALNRVAPKK